MSDRSCGVVFAGQRGAGRAHTAANNYKEMRTRRQFIFSWRKIVKYEVTRVNSVRLATNFRKSLVKFSDFEKKVPS